MEKVLYNYTRFRIYAAIMIGTTFDIKTLARKKQKPYLEIQISYKVTQPRYYKYFRHQPSNFLVPKLKNRKQRSKLGLNIWIRFVNI